MSRSGYGDDGDYSLWHQAVKRSIEGKRGQTFLMELIASLDAMPEKKLAANSFTKGGEVCSLGSVALRRGVDVSEFEPKEPFFDYQEPADRDALGKLFGIAPAMIAEIMWENDEGACGYEPETPEQRWHRMRNWCTSRLDASPVDGETK